MARRKTKQEWLAAVIGTGGIVEDIASRLGVTSRAVTKRKAEDPEFKEAVEEEANQVIGIAESKMVALIKAGDAKAIMWFLDRKAKDRGYGKQVSIEGNIESSGQVHLYLPDNGRDSIDGANGNQA